MNLSTEKLWSHKPGLSPVGEQITLQEVKNRNSKARKFRYVEYTKHSNKKVWMRTHNYDYDCGFLCAPCNK